MHDLGPEHAVLAGLLLGVSVALAGLLDAAADLPTTRLTSFVHIVLTAETCRC